MNSKSEFSMKDDVLVNKLVHLINKGKTDLSIIKELGDKYEEDKIRDCLKILRFLNDSLNSIRPKQELFKETFASLQDVSLKTGKVEPRVKRTKQYSFLGLGLFQKISAALVSIVLVLFVMTMVMPQSDDQGGILPGEDEASTGPGVEDFQPEETVMQDEVSKETQLSETQREMREELDGGERKLEAFSSGFSEKVETASVDELADLIIQDSQMENQAAQIEETPALFEDDLVDLLIDDL
ncbi:MAG: hypothetical protein GF347_05580 [Candidatus Moranbacteria bacterium]|nr:hypothetical protein [Candidatus Moranbacteria bacterium]